MTNYNSMPMLVLRGMVVFPGMLLHFDVGRKKSIAAINKAMDSNQTIFLATQKDISVEDPKFSEVYKIGCVAVIKQILKTPNDTIRVMVEGVCRATVDCVLDSVPYFHVTVNECIEKYSKASELKKEALLRNAREAFEEYVSLSPRIPPDVLGHVLLDNDMGHLADYIASNLPLQYQDKQTILNNLSPAIRLQDLIVILRKECEILRYETEINGIVQRNIDDNQREYYMREQLKVLNEELGNSPDGDDELAEYRKKIAALNASESIKKKLEKEVAKIERMPFKPETVFIRIGRHFNRFEETYPVNQGKLVIGFRAGMENGRDNIDAITVMNDIFGMGTYSKLFMNVREKLSLAYYCWSRLVASKGIVLVEGGIDSDKEKKVSAEILSQLSDLRNGKTDPEVLESSKRSLRERYTLTTPESICAWYSAQVLEEEIITPESRAEGVENVTMEQVCEAAKKLSIDTIFMLKAQEEAENED